MKITALSTGRVRLKPTFLQGSPAHGGQIGLIRAIGRDPGWTQPLPMWSWIIETGSERILIDAAVAGDVTYDLPALHDQRDQAFIAKPEEHRVTLARVLSLVRGGVAYLPRHDPESPVRLAGQPRPSTTPSPAARPARTR